MYMERLEYACMGRENVCIRKGWSVRARGEGECVYMKGVECVCMGRRMKELSMHGETPLHYAAEFGHLHIVKCLTYKQVCMQSIMFGW